MNFDYPYIRGMRVLIHDLVHLEPKHNNYWKDHPRQTVLLLVQRKTMGPVNKKYLLSLLPPNDQMTPRITVDPSHIYLCLVYYHQPSYLMRHSIKPNPSLDFSLDLMFSQLENTPPFLKRLTG